EPLPALHRRDPSTQRAISSRSTREKMIVIAQNAQEFRRCCAKRRFCVTAVDHRCSRCQAHAHPDREVCRTIKVVSAMTSIRRAAALACVILLAAGCSGGNGASSGAGSEKTTGVTITVALATVPPPKATMDAFTKSTGITVTWSNTDWDSLQTKIAAAATAKTYFADATDVDWSRVGQLGKLNWFYPMENYLDTKAFTTEMPQLPSFTSNGHVIGIPYDASFLVTTVNKTLFEKAGITTMPKTIDEYTADLKQIKAKGVVQYPLNIP